MLQILRSCLFVVCSCAFYRRGSLAAAGCTHGQVVVERIHSFQRQAHQLQHAIAVFERRQFLAPTQQVPYFLPVYFEHGHAELELGPLFEARKNVFGRQHVNPAGFPLPAIGAKQREGLAGRGLPETKARAGAASKEVVDEFGFGALVHFAGRLFVPERVVVQEHVVFHVLGQVYFHLVFAHHHPPPHHAHAVFFAFPRRPFPHHHLQAATAAAAVSAPLLFGVLDLGRDVGVFNPEEVGLGLGELSEACSRFLPAPPRLARGRGAGVGVFLAALPLDDADGRLDAAGGGVICSSALSRSAFKRSAT